MMNKAIVLFSGGQDSTTCLIQALNLYDEIHCITFDYGQRNWKEIEVATKLTYKLRVKIHKILNVNILKELSISSLTCDNIAVPNYNIVKNKELPNTFVPGRNIFFLTLASIYAFQIKAQTIIAGICETDFCGYPDCRNEFIQSFNHTIKLGMKYEVRFEMPLMWLNKAEIWALADYWQQLSLVKTETLTCYNNIKGDGCSQCAACYLRARGLSEYQTNSISITKTMKKKNKAILN